MTSFCSEPFDALDVASEVLGLPRLGPGPRDMDERSAPSADASPTGGMERLQSPGLTICRPWLRAANKEQS